MTTREILFVVGFSGLVLIGGPVVWKLTAGFRVTLSQMWRIRQGKSEAPHYPGKAKSKQWSYPYGYEHGGRLYVVYSVGKEDCGLSSMPVAALAHP